MEIKKIGIDFATGKRCIFNNNRCYVGSATCAECDYCHEYNWNEQFVRCVKYDDREEIKFMYL